MRDLVLGSVMLCVAGGYYAMAARIPPSALADSVGPRGLPKIYAALLAGLSLVLIARAVTQKASLNHESRIPDPGSRIPDPGSRPAAAMRLLVIGILYVLTVPWLGYTLALAGLIMTTACHEGRFFNRRVVVTAVMGAAFFWLLFVVLLGIQQPPGIWPGLF